ncbi:MAG: hypothetical protein OET79_11940, partial [Nitrospirota bacterium]|nr:hypothetical protein [Nitrospirota bacterium]
EPRGPPPAGFSRLMNHQSRYAGDGDEGAASDSGAAVPPRPAGKRAIEDDPRAKRGQEGGWIATVGNAASSAR